MKNVLCFGDSNTYGYDPAGMRDGTAVRYAHDVRWCVWPSATWARAGT